LTLQQLPFLSLFLKSSQKISFCLLSYPSHKLIVIGKREGERGRNCQGGRRIKREVCSKKRGGVFFKKNLARARERKRG